MTHHLVLGGDHFTQMYEGNVPLNIRPYTTIYRHFSDNDTVTVEDSTTGQFFTAVLTRVSYFNSVTDAFTVHSYKDIVPSAGSEIDAILFLHTNKLIDTDGLLLFKVTRISDLME
jgi:hypothetical protein